MIQPTVSRSCMMFALSAGLLVLLPSCGKQEPPKPVTAAPPHHEHKAPHGGALAELGDEYAHLEFVVDPEAGTMVCYVLDGELTNLVRIAQPRIDVTIIPGGEHGGLFVDSIRQPLDLALAAVSSDLTGDKVGDCSVFSATDAGLKGLKSYQGKIAWAEVKGKRFENVAFYYIAPTQNGP